ncbi:uncharacterized protein LOC110447110 [Mizuhopecten yessoensis]|uniref:uncharacterized protein LOC110447110 n=1 Tax=Mizuhopecten yessoensis TaxID=6573 RepID=UPI000B457379|nr:uncharacterized protein LOC110447110 [Mizuhopecten yessoensis]
MLMTSTPGTGSRVYLLNLDQVNCVHHSMKRIHIRWGVLRLIIGCALVIIILYKLIDIESRRNDYKYTVTSDQQTKYPNPRGTLKDESVIATRKMRIRKLLQLSAQSLLEANMHIRSSKAKGAMLKALDLFKNVLKEFHIDVPSRNRKSNSTCPEVYHGTSFGYPFFHTGFAFENCKNRVPVEDLVSIIIICQESHHTPLSVDKLVRSIQVHNRNVSVIVAIASSKKPSDFKQLGNINIVCFGHEVSPGAMLNKFASLVSTKYTLIARDLLRLDRDSHIERMVREIEGLNASVVGGATRDENGYWRKGCHQMVYQNYTLVLQDGYTMSLHECIQCDFIEGPFLIQTELFKNVRFDEHIIASGFMEDFFLRLQHEHHATSFVCPDTMFYVAKQLTNLHKDDWKMFGRKWNMRRIILSMGQEINIDCPIDYKCLFWKGFSVSPCCLEELASLVKFIMESCRKRNPNGQKTVLQLVVK